MDPKFVSLLIQQLLNTTHCPKCGSSLNPTNVKIENIGKESCLFKMQCEKCKTVISADAQVAKNPMPQINKNEIKSPSPLEKKPQVLSGGRVTLEDLMQMKKTLHNFSGSFKNLSL